MRVLITRPADDAGPFEAALAERGVTTLREPMLSIRPRAGVRLDLAGVQAFLFTSANGARAFAQLTGERGRPAFAVGDATAKALHELGFARVESAGGNVDDLAALVMRKLDPKSGPLLHAAGSAVAGDLAGRLTKGGFAVERVVLYDALPVDALTPATVTALKARDVDAVALFSPRTAASFSELMTKAGLVDVAPAMDVVALSPAVAEASTLSWRSVIVAETPTLAAMVAAIERLMAKPSQRFERPTGDREQGPTAEPPTIDLKAEEVSADQASPPPAQPARAWPRLATVVLCALVIAGAIYAAGTVLFPNLWPFGPVAKPAPVASPAPVDAARLDRLEAAGAELARRMAATEVVAAELSRRAPTAAPPDPRIDANAAALRALEQRLTQIAAAVDRLAAAPGVAAGLAAEVAALRARLAELERREAAAAPAASAEPTPADPRVDDLARQLAAVERQQSDLAAWRAGVEAVAAQAIRLAHQIDPVRVEAMRESIDDAKERIARLEKSVIGDRQRDTRAFALALAVMRLGQSVATGGPYATSLTAVKALAAEDAAVVQSLAALDATAAGGVATPIQLASRFADAASAAKRAALVGRGEGWFADALDRVAALVTVRRLGDGDDVDGKLSRAESALADGQVTRAVEALQGLPEPAAKALASWLASARQRVAADRALDSLTAATMARLAGP